MYVVRYTWKELITEFFIYCTDVIQIGLQIYHAIEIENMSGIVLHIDFRIK